MHRDLDRTDWAILAELQRDARLSYLALGKLIGLSGPATAERVRRLEAAGIIGGYRAVVDRARVGYSVTAFVRMTCFGGRCIRIAYTPQLFPEVIINELASTYVEKVLGIVEEGFLVAEARNHEIDAVAG